MHRILHKRKISTGRSEALQGRVARVDDVPQRRLRRDRLHRQAPGRAEHHAGRRRGRPALLGHLLGPQG